VPIELVRVQVGRWRPSAAFGAPGPIVSQHAARTWFRPEADGHYLVGSRADDLPRPPYTDEVAVRTGADPEVLDGLRSTIATCLPTMAPGAWRGSWSSWLDFSPDGNPSWSWRPAGPACCSRRACRATPSSSRPPSRRVRRSCSPTVPCGRSTGRRLRSPGWRVSASSRSGERAPVQVNLPAMDVFSLADARATRLASQTSYLELLRVDSLSVGLYELPAGGVDPQSPHDEDEIYVVLAGRAVVQIAGDDRAVGPGDTIFVARHVEHRFHSISEDLSLAVVFAPAESD
jgi:mannose-6-phosphate isomerase-like protein (cupin superfamily)